MSYFRKPLAMGWIPGAVVAAQSQAPLPAPQPAYGTAPGGSVETPPIIPQAIDTVMDLFGLSQPAPSTPTTQPYVPAPSSSSGTILGVNKNLAIIGALAIGALVVLRK